LFVVKKLVQLLAVLVVVSFFSFVLLTLLPGDAVTVRCGVGCTEEQAQELRSELGLDQAIPVQYLKWLKLVVVDRDLQASTVDFQPVSEALGQRLPVTLELVLYAQIIALGVGIPTALVSARRPGGAVDRVATLFAAICISVPNYVFAFVFIAVFAVALDLFPTSGYTSLENFLPDIGAQLSNIWENLRSLFLPALCLALAEMAVYSRLLRNDLIATLQEDYVMMARAKGLSGSYILRRHALRPSTFSLITIAGINMGRLIGGTIIIEFIFNINGMGSYVANAIIKRDGPPLQGAVLIIATGYVLINFAVDMLYAGLDPRIRSARANA
jgi:peptide/nickel transport system permease protein